ncbi:hypothetical protein ZIOFF_058608 [Zingiber officinale]|uniref:Uncharacterized protein n=1 Tax=Zingiber officinale TaxID=94328 RepID=A0A8J5KIC8_ZINOF|nr:hypothetical protein ZIOFF_058608 [Zingiber officinale]
MKRSRAEMAPDPKQSPVKFQRWGKDSPTPSKPEKEKGKSMASVTVDPSTPLPPLVVPADAEGAPWWDLGGGGGSWRWWWPAVEDEKLLGWFPFTDDDFLWGDEDRGDEEDHDLWQLQHIHEIPNSAAAKQIR